MRVQLEIPNTLNDIKLHQYQRFLRIEEPSDMDLMVCMLDSDVNIISNMKTNEFKRVLTHLNSMFDSKYPLIREVSLKGLKIGLIPNLDDITYGENKDISTYLNDWDNMHRAMAVLYRPIKQRIGKKYLIDDYNGTRYTSEMMKDMPLDVVFGVIVFFWSLTNELLNYIPNYLQKEVAKNQADLLKNGVDMPKLMHLLGEI